jgi:hypothetical protein
MTQAGQAAAAATEGLPWAEAAPIWASASAEFAASSSGIVPAIVSSSASFESIFFETELPILLANPEVLGVLIIF